MTKLHYLVQYIYIYIYTLLIVYQTNEQASKVVTIWFKLVQSESNSSLNQIVTAFVACSFFLFSLLLLFKILYMTYMYMNYYNEVH